jgi:DNA-binding HxlR family transcriptional regulator
MADKGEARRRETANSEPRSALREIAGELPRPDEIDRLIHQRTRLGIVSILAAAGRMGFNDLKRALDTSDGNLSVHARKLEEAGYLRCRKSFEGRVPRTDFELTAKGRRELERYLDHMEALIELARER